MLDWERRYLLMRTHTALHVLNGVIWLDHGAQVTGAHMTPGEGRLDFELPAMSQEFARAVEARVNEQVQRDLPYAWPSCRAPRPTGTPRSSG
jgi:misacylated tRNA(Ala) deacylase